MPRRPRSLSELTGKSMTGAGWSTPLRTRRTWPSFFWSTRMSPGATNAIVVGELRPFTTGCTCRPGAVTTWLAEGRAARRQTAARHRRAGVGFTGTSSSAEAPVAGEARARLRGEGARGLDVAEHGRGLNGLQVRLRTGGGGHELREGLPRFRVAPLGTV